MEEKRTLEDRWIDLKAWVGRKKDELNVWIGENKELVMVSAPIVIGSGLELIKVLIKRSNANKEAELKQDYIYDRHAGHYYELKRASQKKRNRQFIEIDRRRENGENLGEILRDMKILK